MAVSKDVDMFQKICFSVNIFKGWIIDVFIYN